MPALAITDSGALYGALEFYKYCRENNVKPILGVEAYIAKKWHTNKDKDNELYSIILLAKNNEGYRNLISLVTESWLSGTHFWKPRIDFDLLEKYAPGLIWLSGDGKGEIPQHISTGKSEEYIISRIEYYQKVFGVDDFYLEIMEHPDRSNQGKINDYLVNIFKKYGHKLVGTNDAHYCAEWDGEAQDMLAAIGAGRSLDDPDRTTLIEGNYSIRPAEEMEELLSYAPGAVKNTLEIAEKCNVTLELGKTLIPTCQLDEEKEEIFHRYEKLAIHEDWLKRLWEEEWYLRYLCITGLNRRYDFWLDEEILFELVKKIDTPRPEKKLSEMSPEELSTLAKSAFTKKKRDYIATLSDKQIGYIERLEYELIVVDLMGFNGYFVIVSDFINWAKDHNIPVGPGRGSAAGALLAYLSGITDIDPLKYGLLFERFLNPSRVSMPDIDVDFSDEGRDQVLEYVRNKYGSDHVAQVCTFGTMAARAAVKDVGKVLGVPFQEMNKLAKLMPSKPGTKIKDALIEAMEFKQAYDSDPHYQKVIDSAIKLEWTVRQLWVHACAVIIAPEPMTHFCALQHPPKDSSAIVTQLSQYPLEDLGLLKMDFLGLRNLTILKRALDIVKANHDIDIDLLKISYEDPKTFKVLAAGDTTGIFQLEWAGMTKYLKELKPTVFEDIIVMVSLYRPGPLAYIPTYIARKHGREKVKYPHPSLEAILKATQGIAVYQEQIMQLVQAFAGFSLGEADILRRAIGKKKLDLLMEQKGKFIDAAKAQWHSEDLAKYIFTDIIEPFAGYGFNKSHAACYAMIAYQTAYMKAYHPTEFMTALMVSDEEDMERITKEIEECKARGINILPPDVNESMKHFTYIDKNNIRFGLRAVKGLWDGPIDTIRKGRQEKPYESIIDFIRQTGGDVINKKSLEALALSGALDRFGDRSSILASITKMTAFCKELQKKDETSQIGLFDMGGGQFDNMKFSLEKATPMSYEEMILGEKQIIGYSVSGHWLDGLKKYIQKRTIGFEHVIAFREKMKEKALLMNIEQMVVPVASGPDHEDESHEWADQIPMTAPISEVAEESKVEDIVAEAEEAEAPKKEEKKKDKRKDAPRVRFIGLVTSIRKIQTKTGKLMMVATCESTSFHFTIVVFPKEYEKFAPLIEENKIVLVEGNFQGNEQMEEISILPNAIKSTTITYVRAQAQEVWLFDPNDKVSFFQDHGDEEKTEQQEDKSQVISDKRQEEVIEPETRDSKPETNKYLIHIPPHATKDNLLELKSFLQDEVPGDIRIWLNIRGQEVDTKIAIMNTESLDSWIGSYFGDNIA